MDHFIYIITAIKGKDQEKAIVYGCVCLLSSLSRFFFSFVGQ